MQEVRAMNARTGFRDAGFVSTFGLVITLGLVSYSAPIPAQGAEAAAGQFRLAQLTRVEKPPESARGKAEDKPVDNSPEAIMNRRFPQKVKVGDLIGPPMLDDNDVTLGRVLRVVRTPENKIKLIVGYSRWFGWFGRPVAVPIEVVAILARQIASLDMPPSEYEEARTWTKGKDEPIPDSEIIRIAVTRR
jgi:hypothetical protein